MGGIRPEVGGGRVRPALGAAEVRRARWPAGVCGGVQSVRAGGCRGLPATWRPGELRHAGGVPVERWAGTVADGGMRVGPLGDASGGLTGWSGRGVEWAAGFRSGGGFSDIAWRSGCWGDWTAGDQTGFADMKGLAIFCRPGMHAGAIGGHLRLAFGFGLSVAAQPPAARRGLGTPAPAPLAASGSSLAPKSSPPWATSMPAAVQCGRPCAGDLALVDGFLGADLAGLAKVHRDSSRSCMP